MSSRAEPTLFSNWWWSIDRVILSALAILTITGIVFLMAGGPPVAERLSLPAFHFVCHPVISGDWRCWCSLERWLAFFWCCNSVPR
jgi:cell division protein FtsW